MLTGMICSSDTAYGTSLCTFTAVCAFIVIDGSAVVIDSDSACRTYLYAL